MNSRERVRIAINHQEPDRVPVDFGGTKVTGLHEGLYCDIVRHLGLDLLPAKVYEQFLMVARPDPMVLKWLGSDVMEVENFIETFGLENKDWRFFTTATGNQVLMPGGHDPVYKDGFYYLYDSEGTPIAYRSESDLYYERCCSTEMSAEITFADPKEWHDSIPLFKDEHLKIIAKRAKVLHDYTDYSLSGGFLRGALGTSGIFAGHTICDWLCLLLTEPEYCGEILQATAERAVENLTMYLQAVGDYIDTILVSGTDFGTQRCELFNPDIFKELHAPNYKMINDYVHEHSHAKVMFHSCGSNYNILGHMIDAGVDIFNPVHTNTDNMEPWRLKKEFGDRLVFWGGGVETQGVLINGTPEEVKAQVRERIEIFGKGGGFVFSGIHNLQYGTPMENLEAMIEAIKEYGEYR